MVLREHQGDASAGHDETLTSSRLLLSLQARDPQAWERLSALAAPLVESWCRRWGLQEADTADVVQEVLRAVSGAIDGFRLDRPGATFRGWLYTIAQSKLHDHWARRTAEPPAEGGTDALERLAFLPQPGPDVSDSQEPRRDRNLLLSQALHLVRRDFQDDTWRAFWGVSVEGRSAAEVAAELAMTKAAVRQAKFRVLQRLRDEFGPLLD